MSAGGRERWWRRGWSVVLAVALLGPALAPGYVLSYDMVWVPDLVLRPDFLGMGSGLPRAVPSDAVVAVLDEVLPGMVLQKAMLLGCLVGGGLGAARLAPDVPIARLAALGIYQWNPLVVERLVIGHWPVLVGYAALPWLVVLSRGWRETGRLPRPLLLVVPLASLSASAGLATALVLGCCAAGRRRTMVLVGLLLAANAPWLMSGLLHAATATTDPDGGRVFALRGEGGVPGPLAALTLGGIWNAEVVPDSRTGMLGWVALVVVVSLAAVGARPWWCAAVPRERTALLTAWGLGWGIATVTALAPGLVGWAGAAVPGLGLFRDGARALVLCAPLVSALVATGVGELRRRAGTARPAVVALVVATALLPVALLPDGAGGAAGRLTAVDYPSSYDVARRAVAGHAGSVDEPGDVLVLPLSSYRAPSWNHDRKVLDPTGRYLPRDFVASDVLVVSGTVVAGEDPRVAEMTEALGRPTPAARTAALADAGIGYVVIDHTAPGATDLPDLAGRRAVDNADLGVIVIPDPADDPVGVPTTVAVGLSWVAFAGLLLASVVAAAIALARRRSAGCYPDR